jgi:UDP-glucose 4-epimerase
MKTLVTGGAGCIGSDLAAELIARGHEVTAFDNFSSGKLEHIEPLQHHPQFRFLEGDLLDAGSLADVGKHDIVFHLAANPDVKFVPGDPTDKDLQQNTLATYNLLEWMRLRDVKKLAFASTSAIYGVSEKQPIPEDTASRPVSLYGATKLGCEALISAFQNLFEMQCWIFRFANIVGEKVRKKGRTVISDFIYKLSENPQRLEILGDGKQAKSYLLSAECVDAMLFIVENTSGGINTYNLGCEDSLSVNRIAQMVVDAMGLRNVEFSYTGGEVGWPGDVPRFTLDVSALRRLGWESRYTSEQAVAQAIQAVLKTTRDPLRKA